MGRKSSIKARKGKAAASKSAAAPADEGGASTSRAPAQAPAPAPAFTPPLHDRPSFSVSAPPAAILTAVPSSVRDVYLLGAPILSSSSRRSADGSLESLLTPEIYRAAMDDGRLSSVEKYTLNLRDRHRRRHALAKLAKMMDFPDLALLLWCSFGTVAILLQELLSIHWVMSTSSLTVERSIRACNVIALFQCVASHPITKIHFTRAHIPFYLYMILSKSGESRAFERVKIATLGVIDAFVKVADTEIITFLLSSDIVPICLHEIESGTEESRTVAAIILQGLLQHHEGLQYVCHFPNQLAAMLQSLENVVASLSDRPSARLLKEVVKCYLHLQNDSRTLKVLRNSFPERFSDGTFDHFVREDQTLRVWLQQLLNNVQESSITQGYLINMSMWMLPVPSNCDC